MIRNRDMNIIIRNFMAAGRSSSSKSTFDGIVS